MSYVNMQSLFFFKYLQITRLEIICSVSAAVWDSYNQFKRHNPKSISAIKSIRERARDNRNHPWLLALQMGQVIYAVLNDIFTTCGLVRGGYLMLFMWSNFTVTFNSQWESDANKRGFHCLVVSLLCGFAIRKGYCLRWHSCKTIKRKVNCFLTC